ncbi:MAG: ATP-dependent sacrificial sulfur transferase LarE [Oscillospiraceae bacterium]|jgi:uncharacterized protein|nr:ATP-dependent sacrificial sulfur transferase LarE [Oscillospiraceae bacterium]
MTSVDRLTEILRSYGKIAVGFSGGVDSTFLLKASKQALGGNLLAVTVKSRTLPATELSEAVGFCLDEGITHEIIETDELAIAGYADNPPDRCYLCKRNTFTLIKAAAEKHGITTIADGSNADDEGDYRPGLLALAELGVVSPLRLARMTKAEIRAASRELGLPTFDKQAFACMSSRFVYGERITAEKLAAVESCEAFLKANGFKRYRVRVHGDLCRIEVGGDELPRLFSLRGEVSAAFAAHFKFVTMDLDGFKSGSMNKTL